jgi:ADP-ribose pyrophosphatase YjhB (NUDIX family)
MDIERHYSATGIVFNENDEILLIKHKKLGVWLPPGGHVDENELPEEAVIRDIFEETGVRAEIVSRKKGLPLMADENRCMELETPFVVLLEDISGNGTHYHIDNIFVCRALNSQLSLNHNEAEKIGWFPYRHIRRMDTFDNVVKVIMAAMQEKENYS